MPIAISGLKELRAALRATPGASARVVSAALKVGAVAVTARAQQLAPKSEHHTGDLPTMVSTLKPFSNTRGAGVKTNHPGAPVQNWAGPAPYYRRNKSGSRTPVSLVNVSAKGANNDRFMYKAVEEVGPEQIDATWDLLVDILKAQGWFEG